jgi:hypothetical protein
MGSRRRTVTDAASGPAAETESAARELLAVCHLVDVRPTRIVAEVLTEASRSIANVGFVPTLEFLAETGQFSNRFTYHFDLNDALGETAIVIEFAVVLDWTVPEDFTPDRSAADFVTRTTGYFAAFPYVRELLHSLTTRLEADPVVLGALNRENLAPTAVTIALRPTGLDYEAQQE